jgi:DNA-binding CsgD family transcriptional regulator
MVAQYYCSPLDMSPDAKPFPRQSRLTARQRMALELVSQGMCTKEIAVAMRISEAGAKKHLDGLRRRYSVANRAELVRRAYESGDLWSRVGTWLE